MPEEPTHQQLEAYYQTIRSGQSVYEDAGGYMLRRIKAFLTGKPQIDHDHIAYKAILGAVSALPADAQAGK